MKKLMIAAAAVMAGFAIQAATCNWSVGYITNPGEGGKGWGTGWFDGSAELQLFTDKAMTIAVEGLGDGAFLSEGDWDEGYAENVTASVLDNTVETTYYGKLILTSADGKSTLESQAFMFETSKARDYVEFSVMNNDEVAGITDLEGKTFDGDYGAFSAAGWQSVPEPTSGLLLLLGVAGLALRRRRA